MLYFVLLANRNSFMLVVPGGALDVSNKRAVSRFLLTLLMKKINKHSDH